MNPIVGIGELLWDVFPDGRKVAGGAPFNFTFHCQQLGHDAVIVSRVGDDELGRELRDEVRRLGLSDEFIQTDHEHPTGTVRVTVDEQGQPAYTITEDVAWDYIGWTTGLGELNRKTRALCYGTLAARREISIGTAGRYIDCIYNSDRPSLVVFDVNMRQRDIDYGLVMWGSGPTADWVKLNSSELQQLSELHWPAIYREMSVAQRIAGGGQVLILTHGEDGCEVRVGGEVIREPGAPARVVDTVGAGDAFTAAMVCLHLEGRPLRECARFANHYAARVCEHQGATPTINRAEVECAAFGR